MKSSICGTVKACSRKSLNKREVYIKELLADVELNKFRESLDNFRWAVENSNQGGQ